MVNPFISNASTTFLEFTTSQQQQQQKFKNFIASPFRCAAVIKISFPCFLVMFLFSLLDHHPTVCVCFAKCVFPPPAFFTPRWVPKQYNCSLLVCVQLYFHPRSSMESEHVPGCLHNQMTAERTAEVRWVSHN